MPLTPDDITISAMGGKRAQPEPFVLVVFGASGDLAHRKLIPALFGLDCEGLLPENACILGFARSDYDDDAFRDSLRGAVSCDCQGEALDEEQWQRFARRMHYHRGSYDDADSFASLAERIEQLASEGNIPANCLFYLATPPETFVPIVEQLDAAGLARRGQAEQPWSRAVVEKPFGTDLDSARELNRRIRSAFAEEQIYRIDHYLGKETVQNLMVLRFANSVFEPIWHQKYVDHVQITVAETVGAEGRGGYYDRAGALRDMVQNHIMHLLCLVAMEPPVALEADAIRSEKVKVLQALREITPECAANTIVRGQYVAGAVDGEPVAGYRELEDVPATSRTETFVAFKAHVDNWRWSGVPFFLRTGKRLARRLTEISIHFRQVPPVLFNTPPNGPLAPNVLVVRVQPDEGISMAFQVKVPGMAMRIDRLTMDFGYAASFGGSPPEAYQRLLLDAALGDPTLFTRGDEVEAAWRYVCPILEGCGRQAPERLHSYPAGSWGPKAAADLIAASGNRWLAE